MPVLIQTERSHRWLNLTVILLLVAIIGIELTAYFRSDRDSAREKARVAATIEAWLADQKAGGDGLQYWALTEAVEPLRFHRVSSWTTTHISPFEYALVQVDVLTEEGDLVSKLWKVYVGIDRHGSRLITRVVDAADGSVPPSTLATRTESPLARKMRGEQRAAAERLESLSRKVEALEAEADAKRSAGRGAGDTADREKQATDRLIADQKELVRMAAEIDRLKREVVAARGVAMVDGNRDPFLVFPGPGNPMPNPASPFALDNPAPVLTERESRFFKDAEDASRRGDHRGAARILKDLIQVHPEFAAAYLKRGNCYAALQDFDKAIKDYGHAIRLAPFDAQAYLARSQAYLAKGTTARALLDAAEALRLDRTLAEAHLIRAQIFDRAGDRDRAQSARSAAVTGFYRRGAASLTKHEYAAGIADFEHVIQEEPDRADGHVWCGQAYYLSANYTKAVQEFTRAITLDPEAKENFNERGKAYFQAGSHDAAIADFDRAIELDPKFDEAYLNRGTVRLAEGKLERAAADFSTVIQLDPRNAVAFRMRAAAFEKMGLHEKAANDLKMAESLSR